MRIWLPSELHSQKLDSNSIDQLYLSSPFFFGRQKELEQLTDLVLDPNTSLISIVGLGGTGKSRLAMELAKSLKDKFPDGVYFIPLSSIDNPKLILHSLADELKLAPHAYFDLKRHLKAYLETKQVLIVLDNFEHLLSHPENQHNKLTQELLNQLLLDAPDLQVIVTSRESIGIQNEFVFELRGLDYPDSETDFQLEEYPSVALFFNESMRKKSNKNFSLEEKAHIAKLCKFLEGSPLAIKLASSWVKTLSLQEISKEMQQNSHFEAVSGSDIPDRHRSMGFVFDQSWKQLTSKEIHILLALSVFKGGVAKDILLGFSGATLNEVSNLVEKSLVQVSFADQNSVTRYDLHELFKQYVRDKLGQQPDLEKQMFLKHCQIFLSTVSEQTEALQSGDQVMVFKLIEPDIDNIRQAWQFAELAGLYKEMASAVMVLGLFFDSRGLIVDGSDLFDRTIELLTRPDAAADNVADTKAQQLELLANLLVRQGLLYSRLSRYHKAKKLLGQSLGIIRQLGGSDHQTALSLNYLGHVEYFLGEYEMAHSHSHEALTIRQACNDLVGASDTLINIGFGAYLNGNLAEAKTIAEDIVQNSLKKEYKRGLAIGLGSLGMVGLQLGDFFSAKNDLERGLRLCKELNLNWFEPWFRIHYSQVLFSLGQYKNAYNEGILALESIRVIGDQFRLIYIKNSLAKIQIGRHDYENAYRQAFEALEMSKDIHHPFGVIISKDLISRVALLKGHISESENYCDEAIEDIKAINQKNILSSLLRTKALINSEKKEPAKAKALLIESISQALETQEKPEALTSMLELSKILSDENILDKSLNLLVIINGFHSAPYWVKEECRQLMDTIEQSEISFDQKATLDKPIQDLIREIMD